MPVHCLWSKASLPGIRAPLAAALLACGLLSPSLAFAQQKPGWVLTFDDEFDETTLDTTKWGTAYKWGAAVINGELEAYVANAFTFSNGIMTINGTNQPGTYAGETLQYSSGLIASVYEQQYGYFEMRAKLPAGQGFWPAFWLMHDPSVPDIKEIDIMEVLGSSPTTLYTTVHWGTSYATDNHQDQVVATVADTSLDFHVYGVEWDATQIIWSFDGATVHTYSGPGVPQVPMYIIANLAIGGTWPGSPNSSTVFPGLYQIDYIRAYQSLDGGTQTDGGSDSSSSSGAGGAGGNAGSTSSAGGASGSASSTTGPTSKESPGGCGCSTSSGSPGAGALLALIGLVLARSPRSCRRRGLRFSTGPSFSPIV